jgi:HEPN domain-containing protein
VITIEQLAHLYQTRLEDAKALYEAGRTDWAIYTCGYVVELALKKKICETLHWKGYPNTEKEFEQLKSLKTHDWDVLLHFSGIEDHVKEGMEFAEWSIITAASWKPEMRYSSQRQTIEKAKLLLDAIEAFLKKL